MPIKAAPVGSIATIAGKSTGKMRETDTSLTTMGEAEAMSSKAVCTAIFQAGAWMPIVTNIHTMGETPRAERHKVAIRRPLLIARISLLMSLAV